MQDHNIRIVELERQHISSVTVLWRSSFRAHYKMDAAYYMSDSEDLSVILTAYLEQMLAKPNPQIRIALEANVQIVGFVIFGEATEDYLDTQIRRFGLVSELFVAEFARASGLGYALMHTAEKWCRDKGLTHVKVQLSSANQGAMGFYRRIGFVDQQHILWKVL